MAIRKQSAVEDALLDFLAERGVPVRARETYGPLAERFGLTASELERQLSSRPGKAWNNLVQWARNELVKEGLLDRSVKGFWSLTEVGTAAAAQRRVVSIASTSPDFVIDGAEPFIDAAEGRAELRMHLVRERSRALIEAFKASLKHPTCQVCGFDFGLAYGEFGAGYIEAHHIMPIKNLTPGTRTKLSDLVPLCANCHRIVHRNGLMSIEQLKQALCRNTKEPSELRSTIQGVRCG